MKLMILCLLVVTSAFSQDLTSEEQKALIEENKFLKAELMKSKSNPSTAESKKMMEALEKGRRFQEEQIKALEELDKEE